MAERRTRTFTQVSFVYRAITALAEQVANIPFRFAAIAEGKDRITTGRLHEFYTRPHPSLNGFQYWELRVMWLLLRGECFRVAVFAERNGRRVLDRVMMLDPSRFRHIVENGELVGWRYQSQGTTDPGQTRVFLPDEVWHERLPNPFDPWRGLSPLSVAAAPAAGEFAATQWMKGLMENNGNAGLVVRTEEPLDQEQREQLKQALRERRRGISLQLFVHLEELPFHQEIFALALHRLLSGRCLSRDLVSRLELDVREFGDPLDHCSRDASEGFLSSS